MATRQQRRLLPALPMPSMDMISTATLDGRTMDATLRDAVCGLGQSFTIEGANVLSLTINDPDRTLLRRELLSRQINLVLPGAGRWRYDTSRDVGGISITDNTLTLKFWCVLSAAMRARTDPKSWSSERMDIGGFARVLANELKPDVAPRILVPFPGEAPDMERVDSKTDSGSAVGFSAKVRLKGKVDDNGKYGYLSRSQLKIAATILQVAADEKAPPKATLSMVMAAMVETELANPTKPDEYGSVGTFQPRVGYSAGPRGAGSKVTREEALDTKAMAKQFLRGPVTWTSWVHDGKPVRGAIEAARLFPEMTAGEIAQKIEGSAHPLRYDKQRAHAKAIIEAWNGGSSSGGSKTATRPARWRRGTAKKRESSWLALEREARRLGRRRFSATPWLDVPRLVVASDQQLIRAQPHLVIDGLDDDLLTESPSIDLEGIADLQTIDLSVVASGWSAPPGAAVHMRNSGPADGPWIVRSVDPTAGSVTAQVVLQQPTTTVEVQADQTTAGGGKRGGSSRRGASTGAQAVYDEAQRISKKRYPYVYGGGHAKAGTPSGGGFDCSAYVTACLAAAGWGYKPGGEVGTSTSMLEWGKPGKGSELTVWTKAGAETGHVFIEFHGAHGGRWADTSPNYGGSAANRERGARLRSGSRATAGFTPRHWQGH